MNACHLLLNSHNNMIGGLYMMTIKNTYFFSKDGHKIVLTFLKSMLNLNSKK